jgi:hypothetical protein
LYIPLAFIFNWLGSYVARYYYGLRSIICLELIMAQLFLLQAVNGGHLKYTIVLRSQIAPHIL